MSLVLALPRKKSKAWSLSLVMGKTESRLDKKKIDIQIYDTI